LGNDEAFKDLNTLFFAFFDLHVNADGISGLELGRSVRCDFSRSLSMIGLDMSELFLSY